MKVCKITYDYFTKEGKYNVYYMNSENSLQKFYEIPEFNVILPWGNPILIWIEDKDNIHNKIIGKKGMLYLVANLDNKDLINIFESEDLEETSKFKTKILIDIKYYDISCRLWKPKMKN